MSVSEVIQPPIPSSGQLYQSSLEFYVEDRDRLLGDPARLRRVEALFNVHCCVQSQQTPREWVLIRGPSREFTEKAKCYIFAMCCPEIQKEIHFGRQDLAGHLFTTSSPLHSTLEKEHTTAILHVKHSDGQNSLCIQGKENNVAMTISRLQSMIDLVQHSPPPLYLYSRETQGINPMHSRHQETISPSPPPPPPPPQTTSTGVVKEELLTQLANLLRSENQTSDRSRNLQYDIIPRDSSFSSQGVPSPSPDPNTINYFVEQLCYPRDEVVSTMVSLGPKASTDDILHRLIRGAPLKTTHNSSSVSVKEQLECRVDPSKLRPIVIDGSNVAMRHGSGKVFSCRGIQLAVNYFTERGHTEIKVFVPQWRKEQSRPESPITDQDILETMERDKILVFTPSRKLNGKRIICYDDRFIVKYAHKEGGVIVSNDQYRDLAKEKVEWRKVIEQRLLPFAFANDYYFMPPDDPLGKTGPKLDQFLRKDGNEVQGSVKKSVVDPQNGATPICPHLGNCTFGKKCRFYHPDREPQISEPALGSGSSGGSYTPTNTSRSATPSPNPDTRNRVVHHCGNPNRGDDSYGQYSSRHSSTDDLYRERTISGEVIPPSGGGSGGGGGGGPRQPSPTKYMDFHNRSYGHGASAPVLLSEATPTHLGVVDNHRHTFPIAHIPRANNSRTSIVTEDHGLLNRGGGLPSSHYGNTGGGGYAPPQEGVSPGMSRSLLTRDVQSNLFHQKQPTQQQPPYYYHQGGGGGVSHTLQPPRREQYPPQISPAAPPMVGYGRGGGGEARVGVPSGYSPSYGGTTSVDQSIPLHQIHQHYPAPRQPHPQGYAPHQPPAPQYRQYFDHQASHDTGSVQDLFRVAVKVLPGCGDRIRHVIRLHPELTSEADILKLVELVKQLP